MIDGGAFIVVAAATIRGDGSIVLFFSLAIRLGSEARDPERQRVRALPGT